MRLARRQGEAHGITEGIDDRVIFVDGPPRERPIS
jgi:hypothetical protein